jgi:spore germination protein GerM
VSVFLIDPQAEQPHLVERERATESPGPIEAVNRLLGPITEEEADEGLISRIPGETVLLLETSGVADGVATLDLSSDIETVAGDVRAQMYAQLVYTATQFEAQVRTVRFLTEGQPVTVPTVDQGDLAEVTRGDYRELRPEPGS